LALQSLVSSPHESNEMNSLSGELLDLDGLIGISDFQPAWSTGELAGEIAAPGLRA